MQFTWVPGANDVSPAVGVVPYGLDHFVDLIYGAPVRFSPIGPLGSVHSAQVTFFVGPLVPNGDFVVIQVLYVGLSFQEPEKFVDNGTKVQFLRGQQGKLIFEGIPHLSTEHGISAGTRSVVAISPLLQEVFK